MRKVLKNQWYVSSLLAGVLLVVPFFARAQTYDDLPGGDSIFAVFENIFDWMFAAAIVIVPFVVLYSGFLFLTGGGDPAKISRAKTVLLWGAVGVVIALVAIAVPDIVRSLLGV